MLNAALSIDLISSLLHSLSWRLRRSAILTHDAEPPRHWFVATHKLPDAPGPSGLNSITKKRNIRPWLLATISVPIEIRWACCWVSDGTKCSHLNMSEYVRLRYSEKSDDCLDWRSSLEKRPPYISHNCYYGLGWNRQLCLPSRLLSRLLSRLQDSWFQHNPP